MYITEDDLKAYIPAAELTNITETIDATTNVAVVIENVCSLADSYLQNHYDLPIANTYDLKTLKAALCKIAVWELSGFYASLSDNVKEKRKIDKEDAMKYLGQLASGEIKLVDATNAITEENKYAFDSNPRITRDFR